MPEIPLRQISQHKLFPWALGVWCAALTGGGVFAVPAIFHAILLGRLGFYKIGIDPRLAVSMTAALVGALVGIAIGFFLARRFRAAAEAEPDETAQENDGEVIAPLPSEGAAVPGARVFDARAELAEAGIAPIGNPTAAAPAAARPAGRRRKAAVPEPVPAALGDLSLGQLTERLSRALAAAHEEPARPSARGEGTDPQEALRTALETLSRSDRR